MTERDARRVESYAEKLRREWDDSAEREYTLDKDHEKPIYGHMLDGRSRRGGTDLTAGEKFRRALDAPEGEGFTLDNDDKFPDYGSILEEPTEPVTEGEEGSEPKGELP